MQTCCQRYSRQFHQRHQSTGQLWARRFRACLLADDTALLAAIAVCERTWKHRQDQQYPPVNSADSDLSLTELTGNSPRSASTHYSCPLVVLPDGQAVPADTAPISWLGSVPDEARDAQDLLLDQVSETSLLEYEQALFHGWCLGLSESLHEVSARLGRPSGRGRSRQIRELDDEWGLCGLLG